MQERIAAMNKKIKDIKEKEAQKARQNAIELENNKPSNILHSLYKQNKIEAFKNKFNSLPNKDEVFAEFIHKSDDNNDDNLNAIKILLQLGAKPTKYYCSIDVIINNHKYKILLLLIQNQHYKLNKSYKTFSMELVTKHNLSFDYIQQLQKNGCTLTQSNGSPLYFAVAHRNILLIKWLFNEKQADIHASPTGYSDYPPIAACIEMLKERYRDWYVDRNPIDKTLPKYWDLDTDKEWIQLCNLLQLIVGYGGNPFKNYSIVRQFGQLNNSPKYKFRFNVSRFHTRYDLNMVEKALINGFRERIDTLCAVIQGAINIQIDICNIIALLLIGEYYDQPEWEMMVNNSPQIPYKFDRYMKMAKIGFPIVAIENKMRLDGMTNDEININDFKKLYGVIGTMKDVIVATDDDYPISMYAYNNGGDPFPRRTTDRKYFKEN
eukprot:62403_1